MRLPARRIATTALCAGLLIGLSGPAVMAADGESARERTHAVSQAPLPDLAELQSQVADLAGLGGVLTPVTDLLNAILKADDGRLPATEADQFAAAVKDALAKAEAADADADDTVNLPGTTTPAQPPTVTAPQAGNPVTLPAPVVAEDQTAAASDLTATAYADLQKRIDALVKATTAGNAEQVSPAIDEVMTGIVNVVAATLVGNGMPAADLAGLPALPAAPEATTPDAAVPANPLPANPS
ncbi:hypothetical protein DMH12_31855 [Streptomyces sp. WAC 04229]|uniref:hypothetical protein n=1 Tax=Streptomyces sp. WAC 04229 TaxID=2203206 RepID=UPI000F74834A|nr:hypothetical protein [Streptomyces sp. WAC 04229]RSN44253.1 hypothetical protein DMH12_31855 [Streptomyces sp. WAC 04229]